MADSRRCQGQRAKILKRSIHLKKTGQKFAPADRAHYNGPMAPIAICSEYELFLEYRQGRPFGPDTVTQLDGLVTSPNPVLQVSVKEADASSLLEKIEAWDEASKQSSRHLAAHP
jgi:hypothetical protein